MNSLQKRLSTISLFLFFAINLFAYKDKPADLDITYSDNQIIFGGILGIIVGVIALFVFLSNGVKKLEEDGCLGITVFTIICSIIGVLGLFITCS